jgi:putative Mn2+ efflux pump MntP
MEARVCACKSDTWAFLLETNRRSEMGLLELLLIAIGLSMDAFAVAVCHGLSMQKAGWRKPFVVGLYFGIFQAVMPLIGYLVGSQFSNMIVSFGHWIAFVLLVAIGAKLIFESFKKEGCPDRKCPTQICTDRECPAGQRSGTGEASLKPAKMLPLAIATSIDALAVGVSFAFLNVAIIPAVSFIGIITLVLSMVGVKIGNMFGARYKSKAEFAGGVILVLMGLKTLLEHLEII